MKRKNDATGFDELSLKKAPTVNNVIPYRHLTNGIHFTKINCLSHDANANAFSLYEIIHRINPIVSIHFNYCMDPQFILKEYPKRCRNTPITLVVGEQHAVILREVCESIRNVNVEAAQLPFPYGTHHSKLSLFESDDALHIMISTANLIPDDYNLKTQCFYYFRAPFVPTCKRVDTEGNAISLESPFRAELIAYLEGAYANKIFINYWLDRLRNGDFDFSENRDHIIASYPGRFIGQTINKCGHMKLRKVLQNKFSAEELNKQTVKLAQFSSIGSLGTSSQVWLCDEFLRSLNGGCTSNMNPNSLKLIYPSVENVRTSLEGYAAGQSLPYNSKTHAKQHYLRNMLYQWRSNRYERTRAMPHVKSYASLDESDAVIWLLITSANLSQAAWGRLEKGASQLFCRSYELGVLICCKDHPQQNSTKTEQATGAERKDVFLPYDLPLTKYSNDDHPFTYDTKYPDPDINDHFSTSEYV